MTEPTATLVGARIREIRESREVSLRVLAGLAGISPGYLSMIENGDRDPDKRATLEKIARALRVSPTALGAAPQVGPLDPETAKARDSIADVEAALTEVALGEQTVNPRPLEAAVADVEHLSAVLRPRSELAEQMQLLPNLIRELNALLVVDPAKRRAILENLGHVLCATTFTTKHVGIATVPGLAAVRLREVADELDEPHWHGLANFARTQTLGSGGRERMRELSRQAADGLQPHIGTSAEAHEIYGILHLNSAFASAILGDEGAALDHFEEARELAESVPEPAGVGWANQYFNRTNVMFWRATLALELGEPDRVVSDLSPNIYPEKVVSLGRQGSYYVDLGRALATMRNRRDEAVTALVRAEACAPVRTRSNVWARSTTKFLLGKVKRDSRADRDVRGLAYRMGLAA